MVILSAARAQRYGLALQIARLSENCRMVRQLSRREPASALKGLVNGKGRSVSLEEFARQKIRNEVMHVAEIGKMLRRRGDA